MVMALSAKNKIGFIDGSIPAPDAADPLYRLWIRNNDIVGSWLLNSISKEVAASVTYSSNAAAIWKDLEDRFRQKNGPRILQLKRELDHCTQGSLSVLQYYTKIKTLWEELSEYKLVHHCHCGGVQPLLDHFHFEYILTFLMGLNESYNPIRGQILTMDPTPSIQHVFSLVLQEEKQREVGLQNPVDPQIACAVQGSQSKSGKKDKDRPICAHCGLLGHTKDKCFKIIGYPPGHKKAKAAVNYVQDNASQQGDASTSLNMAQCQQMISFLQSHMARVTTADTPQMDQSQSGMVVSFLGPSSKISHHSWILDSGATSHICHDLKHFSHYTYLSNRTVTLPNNYKITVKAIGTVNLSPSLKLHNVLYIPSFHVNIISISSFLHNTDSCVIFHDSCVLLQDKQQRKVIGKGNLSQGLYLFQPHSDYACSSMHTVSTSFCNNVVDANLWHARMGHLSDNVLKLLSNKISFSVPKDFSTHNCSICPLSKFRKLPFVSNNNFSKQPFDLIHCDVWGPFSHDTHNGMRYFLTIVDDCTRFNWVHLMRSKSEAPHLIQAFFKLVQTQFSKPIKALRSDNAKELALTDFLQNSGTIHQLSCPHRPQQNSVVERRHQHLLNVA